MDVSYLLEGLNDKQREAVAAPRINMLVLNTATKAILIITVNNLEVLWQICIKIVCA